MTLLEVQGLTTQIELRSTTVSAVDGVSFSVERGETVGLVGESGCGKSMTAGSIMQLLPPGGRIVAGRVRLEGADLSHLGEAEMRRVRGNQIGMVFQDSTSALDPTMTVGRQIAEQVELHRRVGSRAALDRAEEVLALVGVPRPAERLGSYPHQLSGGLRQRVAIAMALSCEPQLLIADEPTTSLDVTIQAQILGLIDDLKHRLGMGVILVTHDLGVVAGRTDKTLVMYAGRIIEQASTRELFSWVRHPYTAGLLASIPKTDQDPSSRLHSIPGLPPDLSALPDGCRFAPRCDRARDRCRVEEPVLGGASPRHPYACFYPTSVDVTAAPGGTEGLETPAAPRADSAATTGRESEPLLTLTSVSKRFAVHQGSSLWQSGVSLEAVRDLTLDVRRGETLGLVGESGCGKTTVGRLMVALERPTSGTVTFRGDDLSHLHRGRLRRTRADLQLMFQDSAAALDPHMRIGPILGEPLVVQHRGSSARRTQKTLELLEEVGLRPAALQRHPSEFSDGQRQRIGLARALALNPRLIVADEPVSSLDVSIRSQILNLMKRLQAEHDLTYVLISHDLSVIRYMADRIGVMYLGRLVEIGTGDDIYHRAAHPYTAGLLASVPVPDPDVERDKRGRGIAGELPSPINPPSGCRFRTRCPRAEKRCEAEAPPMASFGGEHRAACHFPLQVPVTVTARREVLA